MAQPKCPLQWFPYHFRFSVPRPRDTKRSKSRLQPASRCENSLLHRLMRKISHSLLTSADSARCSTPCQKSNTTKPFKSYQFFIRLANDKRSIRIPWLTSDAKVKERANSRSFIKVVSPSPYDRQDSDQQVVRLGRTAAARTNVTSTN